MSDPLADHTDQSDAAQSMPTSHSNALDLPQPLQQILRCVTRQRQVSLAELAQHFEQEEATLYRLLMVLVEQGFVQVVELDGASYYCPKLATRKGRTVPSQVWEKLEG